MLKTKEKRSYIRKEDKIKFALRFIKRNPLANRALVNQAIKGKFGYGLTKQQINELQGTVLADQLATKTKLGKITHTKRREKTTPLASVDHSPTEADIEVTEEKHDEQPKRRYGRQVRVKEKHPVRTSFRLVIDFDDVWAANHTLEEMREWLALTIQHRLGTAQYQSRGMVHSLKVTNSRTL